MSAPFSSSLSDAQRATMPVPPLAADEAAIISECDAQDERVAAEGNGRRRAPVHHFDRGDTVAAVCDTMRHLAASGHRARLDWRGDGSADLYVEPAA